MDVLFLFTKNLDKSGCLGLKLDSSGTLLNPLAQFKFNEIFELQKQAQTIIVESSAQTSILCLEMSWLPDSKARIAIPFALEDQLAQPVNELHFAYAKTHYHNNSYTVIVIDKKRMQFIKNIFQENNIVVETITIDWFALSSPQAWFIGEELLINSPEFKGSLAGEMLNMFLGMPQNIPTFTFADTEKKYQHFGLAQDKNFYTAIAQNILISPYINLFQGEMKVNSKTNYLKSISVIACSIVIIWLISLIIVNGLNLHFINKDTILLDQQIATIYHEYFPNSKQIISPKFRISRLLKNSNSNDQTQFWFLLEKLAEHINPKLYTIEHLNYQNMKFTITILCSDFASLEQLESKLKKIPLQVKQTQASSQKNQVLATLEIN